MNKLIYKAFVSLAFFSIAALLTGCRLASNTKDPLTLSDKTPINPADIQVLTIGTADSGGTMYPVGAAIADSISNCTENIKVNISASNGSFTNVVGIMEGQIDLGLVSGDVAFSAYNGSEEFEEKPAVKLRAVAAVYSSLSNWMAPVSSGLIYVHDLEGKVISVGPKDSTTELSARIALGTLGLDASNTIFKNYSLGSSGKEVKQGNLDAIHGFAGIPISGLTKLSNTVPSALLKYTEKELDSILSQNPFYYKAMIPSGTYPGQNEDIKTFGVKCLICVNENMDEKLVYTLTKILDENSSQMANSHKSLSSMDQAEFMYLDLPIPLHPGAKRYYEEAGYLKD